MYTSIAYGRFFFVSFYYLNPFFFFSFVLFRGSSIHFLNKCLVCNEQQLNKHALKRYYAPDADKASSHIVTHIAGTLVAWSGPPLYSAI